MWRLVRFASITAVAFLVSYGLFLWNPVPPSDHTAVVPWPPPTEVLVSPDPLERSRGDVALRRPTPPEDAAPPPGKEPPAAALPVPPRERGSPEGTTDKGRPRVRKDASPAGSTKGPGRDVPAEAREDGRRAETPKEDPSDRIREIRSLMESQEYRASAERELSGELRHGFETEVRCGAGDQLELARFFGEPVVLVPRSALDADSRSPFYYRLDPGRAGGIERVEGIEELRRYRRYRDLFDFDFEKLPAGLQALRRKILPRSEIYLFAALTPLGEWALVVARRKEAWDRLREARGATPEVRKFTMRYVPLQGGRFDIRVEEMVLKDGTRIRPGLEE